MNSSSDPLLRSRATLVLLATLFFAPFIAAWVIYTYFPSFRPDGTTNYGTLVSPARPLPEFLLHNADGTPASELFHEKWSLVYLGTDFCDDACEARLILIRQVRLALGKDLSRLVRVYIAPDQAALSQAEVRLGPAHPGLKLVRDDGEAGHRASEFFTGADAHGVYLVDPNGNWLMLYTGNLEPKPLLGDLKKLLRLSSIG